MSFDYKHLFLITYFLHFLTCRPEVLGLFTLSTSLDFKSSLTLSLFLHIISFYNDKKGVFFSVFSVLDRSSSKHRRKYSFQGECQKEV